MRDAQGTRTRIQETALRLFVDKGVTETTVRDIAAGAAVAEGTLYRHYASKDDLVWDLFSTHYAAFARTLDELQTPARGLKAKLAAMVGGFCAFFDRDWVLFSFLLVVQHPHLKRVGPGRDVNPVEVIRAVLIEAMERAEIPARDPDLATAMVMGIVLRPAIFTLYGRIARPMIPLAGDLAEACWKVLTP